MTAATAAVIPLRSRPPGTTRVRVSTWATSIPIGVLTNGRGIDTSARNVLRILAEYANNDTWIAWPGQQRIARETGHTRKTVGLALRRLESAGLIAFIGVKGTVKRWRLGCERSFTDVPDLAGQRAEARRKRTAERTRAWRARRRSGGPVTHRSTHPVTPCPTLGDAAIYPPVTPETTHPEGSVTLQSTGGDAPFYPRTSKEEPTTKRTLKTQLLKTPDACASGGTVLGSDPDTLFEVPDPPPSAPTSPVKPPASQAQQLAKYWYEITNGECTFPAALAVLKKFRERSEESMQIALRQILLTGRPLTVEVLRSTLNGTDRRGGSSSNQFVRANDDPVWSDPKSMSLDALH